MKEEKFSVWRSGEGGWCISWTKRETSGFDPHDPESVRWVAAAATVSMEEILQAVAEYQADWEGRGR